MQNTSNNDANYKIPIRISKNVQLETSDNILVVGTPKQESAEKILIPNLLSGTDSYLIIDPDGIIRNKTKDTMETSLDKGTQRKTTENELPSLTQCTA